MPLRGVQLGIDFAYPGWAGGRNLSQLLLLP